MTILCNDNDLMMAMVKGYGNGDDGDDNDDCKLFDDHTA